MSEARKRVFIEALEAQLRDTIAGAHQAEATAGDAAAEIQQDARRREDAKEAVVQGRLSAAHRDRRERTVRELERLRAFTKRQLRNFSRRDPVALGALIDVTIEGEGDDEERSLFLLPVGAGADLEGPGGDGFVSVATPQSPIGRALLGACVGDTVEVVVGGRDTEWTVLDLC
ncbi:MAG: GreA/GreB family elongation factor [Deltaproteobacteria bacterium]|nr:GreA/GreB family elongation factor [Deltaproteobacteria bacterium]MBW2447467.1 GreA/GreB family elongation factor [Deltaproteobacteria bacterium]